MLIPIYDEKGNCINFKHKPDPTGPNASKGMYSIAGRGGNRLFNIQVLLGKTKPQEVIICEGEWDCMMLTQQGYTAITATGGTGNFKPEWIEYFKGVPKIYICQDNDENKAGQRGASKIGKLFANQKIKTYIVNLPNPKKGFQENIDVTDFFTVLGKTKEHFDLLLETAQEYEEPEKEDDNRKISDILVELAIGTGLRLFLDQSDEAHFLIPDEPLVAYPVNGSKLRGWLSSRYMEAYEKSFSGQVFTEVKDFLYAKAVHENNKVKLWNRVAMVENTIYYDIGDGRRVVKIDKNGWEIKNNAPGIKFRRFTHQLVQVEPQEGDISDVLEFVNLKTESDKLLYLTYLVTAFNPIIPRALLTFYGDQGSSKSTTARLTRSIIDPSNAGTHHPSISGNLLSPPKDDADLANKSLRHYALFFDNLSYCPDWMSDSFARIITGATFSKRKLYTDTDEVTINSMPLLGMNGINLVAEKPDLLDRLLILEMERIPEEKRMTEREFWNGFHNALPGILGGLFDVLSKTLAVVDTVNLRNTPRLADYTTFAAGVAIAIGRTQEELVNAFNLNMRKQNQSAIDSSVVAQVILEFMEDKDNWEGSSSELHKRLLELAENSNLKVGGASGFPKSSNWLWKKIQLVRPNLATLGINAEHNSLKSSSQISFKKSKAQENTSDASMSTEKVEVEQVEKAYTEGKDEDIIDIAEKIFFD